MTLRDVILTVARRWYVVVIIFGAAIGVFALLASGGGVYSARTTVSFMLQHDTELTPDNSSSNESIIAFAGIVASTINRAQPAVRYSSGEAPYYGAGLRQGVLVGLRDEGTQWAPSYGSAVIEIRIVGPTHEWVSEKQETILGQIRLLTEAHQVTAGARPGERITSRVEPLTLEIEHIKPSNFAVVAAGGAALASSSLVSMWAAVTVDRLLRIRAHRAVHGRGVVHDGRPADGTA